MIDDRYPNATRFLKEHPEMDLDQAINYLEKETQ
jgi:hypothetical protein